MVPATAESRPILEKVAAEKGLVVEGVQSVPTGGHPPIQLRRVRIGLWDQYGGSMPSGWIRWMFEQYEFPFEVVFPRTLDAGNLAAKYDVLVFVGGGIPGMPGVSSGGRGGPFGPDAGDFGRLPDPESI